MSSPSLYIQYFNFPIMMLDGFLKDYRKNLVEIRDYALYQHAIRANNHDLLAGFRQAIEYYKLSYTLSDKELQKIIKNSGKWSSSKNHPHVGLNVDIYEDYMYNTKTENDITCLLCYLALKSIIGTSSYCKTNNKFLFARMGGKTSVTEYKNLPDEFKKYTKSRDTLAYWSTQFRNSLEQWHFVFYSYHTRGFYASLKLKVEDLAVIAEGKKKMNRQKIRKRDQKEAYQKALKKLGIE